MSDDTPQEPSDAPGEDGAGDDLDNAVAPTITRSGSIEPIEIQQEMEQSFLDYAMSVIVARALPDARVARSRLHPRPFPAS